MHIHAFTFNPFQENTYVIWDDGGACAIIDPGCFDSRERAELESFIDQKGLRPIKLLNTHCHVDHVLGNRFVAEKYGLGLEMHRNDLPVLEAVPTYARSFGFDTGEMVTPSVFLDEGDIVEIGNLKLNVLHVPGHSPGSICFYHHGTEQIISGDALFHGSIGRTDLPGGNHGQLIRAIKEKLLTLPDDVTVFSGHGPETTIGYERMYNPFLQ